MDLKCNIKIVSIGRQIFVKTAEQKIKIIETLKEKQINFFTHPDNDNKIFKVVLAGLPQVPIEEIEKCLRTEYNITPTKIIMFNTKVLSKLYLIHFNKKDVSLKTLNTVKSVYHHIVKWLPYKPKNNGPTQCYRCCMYGHGASSCNRFAVCMICSGGHLTAECTLKPTEGKNPIYKCFNCASNEGMDHNHKANDASCPFRAKYERARANAKERNNNSKSTNTNTQTPKSARRYVLAPKPTPLRTTFASALKTPQRNARAQQIPVYTTPKYTQASTNSNIENTNNDELWSIAEVTDLLFNSINELNQCKTKLDQLKIITNLLRYACT